jgi:anti-sigma regulatory factor (Ser/Thr protein kinase)
VRDELRHLDDLGWILGDVMLVARELVNNAVVHSGGAPHHDLEIRAWRDGGRLTVSVRDPGISGQSAGPRQPTRHGGWGLRIVEALSERWGEERDNGYRVWADINLEHHDRQSASL